MRIVAFRSGGEHRFGLCRGDEVREIAGEAGRSTAALFAALAAGEPPTAGEARPLSAVELLMPVPNPGKVICIGLNYVDHAKEGGNPIPDYPAVFLRVNSSLVGPDQPILRPAASDKLDYEAELAIIIGSTARAVSEDAALAHVGAYSCFNDGSLRDYQRKSAQWTMGKNFDATGAFGPWMVTPEELPPGAAPLRITTTLNGQVLQDGNTGNMIFSVAKTVAILSEVMTLEPGDVIITGTPAGVGYPRKPPIFMRPGDVCEVEVEGIGVLRSPIADAPGAAA
ncbi:fumarylacetoacetate hydrolase family protein [Roseomonas sp. BN140053]|uniref:fumarylacetoacetate hydrolase family protein n=1 Tax=Roseomonas sp. BN140053 TaxID=3391898 RepID=UPI0039EC2967